MVPQPLFAILATCFLIFLALLAIWQLCARRGLLRAPALLALCVAASFWGWLTLATPGAGGAEPLAIQAKLQYAVTVLVPSLWVVFAVNYTGRRRWFTFWVQLCVLGLPLATLALILTDSYHHLIWTLEPVGPGRPPLRGPWFWLHAFLAQLLLAAGSGLLIRHVYPQLALRLLPMTLSLVTASTLLILSSGSLVLSTFYASVPDLTPALYGVSALALWLSPQLRRQGEAAPEGAPQPDLTTIMSHELRSLMSGIVSVSDLLERTPLDNEQQRLLGIVRTSGRSLLDVVNNTLDLAAADARSLTLQAAPFALRECIEDTLDAVAIRAMRKRLHLGYLIDEGVPERLIGDGKRLGQVLLNLVGNSVKFTAEGGVLVLVSGQPAAPGRVQLRFAVTDTGPGIAEEQRHLLFQPFSQLQSGLQAEEPGSGLGLAISRQLVARMGGELALEHSSAVGTTFTFTIDVAVAPQLDAPLSAAHPDLKQQGLLLLGKASPGRAMLAAAAQQWGMTVCATDQGSEVLGWLQDGRRFDAALVVSGPQPDGALLLAQLLLLTDELKGVPVGLVTWLQHEEAAAVPAPHAAFQELLYQPVRHADLRAALLRLVGAESAASPALASPRPRPLNVLVVDDHPLSRDLAQRMLQALGHHAEMAGTGAEALQALSRRPYDVLLLDMHIAGLDGVELARQIRSALPEELRPYIVAVTGERRSEPAPHHRDAGIMAWRVKPLTIDGLATALAGYEPWRARQGATPIADGAPWDGLAEQPANGYDEALDAFLRFDRDPQADGGFVDQYLSDTEQLVAEMRASLRNGDTRRIAQVAHKLKSSSAFFSEHGLVQLCTELDDLAASSYFQDYDRYILLIEAEYQRVRVRHDRPPQG